MWVLPTLRENSPVWEDLKTTAQFSLQKIKQGDNLLWKSLMGTIQTVFDTKDAPYRIVVGDKGGIQTLVISQAESKEEIERDWKWIVNNLTEEVAQLENIQDIQNYVGVKIQSLVAANDDSSGADASSDEKFRTAARKFKQTFQLEDEKLINYYACSYEKSSNQGWMYISESYLCFVSLIFGVETKIILEMKDITQIEKAKSKKGLVNDALNIVMRDTQSHFFANMFHRSEIYDLLQQLANMAAQRLLKSAAGATAPGAATNVSATTPVSPAGQAKRDTTSDTKSIRQDLGAKQRNTRFQTHFRLPTTEEIIADISCHIWITDQKEFGKYDGRLYVSNRFLCFTEGEGTIAQIIVPLFCVRKLERITAELDQYAMAVTTCHNVRYGMLIGDPIDRKDIERFTAQLAVLLKENVKDAKQMRVFVEDLPSERLNKSEDTGIGGLGIQWGYPMSKVSKEKSKLKYWSQYFDMAGMNMTIARNEKYGKLVRIGLPNQLRGEMWELNCGAIFERYSHQGEYQSILEANKGNSSMSTDEIEKDLNRSLPEYPAYQSPDGIDALRRVLSAYSWKNPELGYCQAMNILTSAMLIFLSEEQAFWVIWVLCDKWLPGYYATTMQSMPLVFEHFRKRDVQLSVVSLPWFLTLYINSLPLVNALRILDWFFLEGPKVLFQVALGLLKINADQLLSTTDDGELMNIFKTYFASMDELAYPNSANLEARQITKFTQLLLTAYRDFGFVTAEMVTEMRRTHQMKVVQGIESYAKRSAIRNLPTTAKFDKADLMKLYDHFCSVQFYCLREIEETEKRTGVVSSARRDPAHMDFDNFHALLSELTSWARIDPHEFPDSAHPDNISISSAKSMKEPIASKQYLAGMAFVHKLFNWMDQGTKGYLKFEDIVWGFGKLCRTGDLMSRVEWCYDLFKSSEAGIDRDDIIQLSETMLFILRKEGSPSEGVVDKTAFDEKQEEVLRGVSNLIHTAFEFLDGIVQKADAIAARKRQEPNLLELSPDHSPTRSEAEPDKAIPLNAFRALILSEPFLELYLDQGMPKVMLEGLDSGSLSSQRTQVSNRKEIMDQFWSNARGAVKKWTGRRNTVSSDTNPMAPPPAAAKADENKAASVVESLEHIEQGMSQIAMAPLVPLNPEMPSPPPKRQISTTNEDGETMDEVDRLLLELEHESKPGIGQRQPTVSGHNLDESIPAVTNIKPSPIKNISSIHLRKADSEDIFDFLDKEINTITPSRIEKTHGAMIG